MLGHRISIFGSAIVKQLARDGYLSTTYGTRNLQRSYAHYVPSPPVTSQEALFLNNHMFSTASTTSSDKAVEGACEASLACCKLYISEARNKTALEAIERATTFFPPAAIVNKFEDAAYGRVGYTLVSTLSSSSLNKAVFAMVKTALDTINLDFHCGSHPRLGVVDHICFHPLSHTSMEQVSAVANSLAMDIGSILRVPTYLYGAATEEQCTLDSIRRKLGYFKANKEGHEWAGGLELEEVPVKPDAGPQEISKAKGVVTVGACGWVSNYNVPVMSSDLKAVRRIGRKVSERGGGLSSVQTMALVHGEGVIEVACNLLNPSQVGGDEVQGLIEKLGREEGLIVGKGYYTDYTPDQILQRYKDLFPNS